MLNEFLVLERGLSAAGFQVVPRHPDVQSPGKSDALHVRLDRTGAPVEASLLSSDRVAASWTLRNGQHNSFPYVQLKRPLLSVPSDNKWHEQISIDWKRLSLAQRRKKLGILAADYPVSTDDWTNWPHNKFKMSIQARHDALSRRGNDQIVASAVMVRFLRACEQPARMMRAIIELLIFEIGQADKDLVELARSALVGKARSGKSDSLTGAPLYFDVARGEFARDVVSADNIGPVSEALRNVEIGSTTVERICALSGLKARTHQGNFPQPKLPILGQIYLFAKNEEIKAAHRYGRAADEAMQVSSDLMERLAGALTELTAEHRRGQTWRSIPGERSKQNDLLLAFVDNALEAPLADALVNDDDDWDDEGRGERGVVFLKRAERIIEAVKIKVGADFRKTPATLSVFRKVEPGNAKAILYRCFSTGELYEAAKTWSDAQENTPNWLEMPVATSVKSMERRRAPAIAPLQLPKLTRATFIREGREAARRELVGIPAEDALTLFLNEGGAPRIAKSALRLVLGRQGAVVSGAAHALRKDASRTKLHHAHVFDRGAALRASALLGTLLAKLGRRKEDYMSDVAFKLGQLLAAADTIHTGYCTDVRKGDVPPTLLGNSVLATAQSDPTRALSILSRRWGPYAAWARRPSVAVEAFKLTRKDATVEDKRRGWPMRTAIHQAERAGEVCSELHGRLPRQVDDVFRAELLLGYVAGLPKLTDRGATKNQVGEINE